MVMSTNSAMNRREILTAALLPLVSASLLTSAPESALAQGGSGRRAVVFLSRSGNTRVLAGALSRRYSADMFEVRPRDPWPDDYDEMVAWASSMRASDVDVPLAETRLRIDQYQT